MSELESVKAHIDQARNEVNNAWMACSQGENAVRESAEEFGMLGVEALATVLFAAADQLGVAVANLGTAAGGTESTVTSLASVTEKTQVGQTIDSLGGVSTQLNEALNQTAVAVAAISEAMQHIQQCEVEGPVSIVANAATVTTTAQTATQTAKDRTDEYRQKIEVAAKKAALSAPARASKTSSTVASGRAVVTSTRTPGGGRFDPTARDPQRSEAIRRCGWPQNQYGRTMARGLLFDAKGDVVLHQPLKALSAGKVYNTPELKEPWSSDRGMKVSWHVEGGVAAYMRKTGTRDMVLYLNVPPCGGSGRFDEKGCHSNLPKILPKGYTLHVHVERENGRHDYMPYVGTGEALK